LIRTLKSNQIKSFDTLYKLEGQPCEKLESFQIDLSTHQPKGHHLENPWYTKILLAVGID
jgi:hypothetical protein